MRKSLYNILIMTLVAALPIGAQRPGAVGGTLSGSVTGEDGTAVIGTITLRHINIRTKSRVPTQVEWRAKLDQTGGFRFPLLPSGEYLACARAADASWLDPCEWEQKAPSILLPDGQLAANVKLILKRGVAVDVNIEDRDGLIRRNEGKTAGAGLLLAIASDGLQLRVLPLYAQDASSRTYRLFVPSQRTHRLIVQSTFYKLTDTLGAPLRETQATVIPFTPISGKPLPITALKVQGTKR